MTWGVGDFGVSTRSQKSDYRQLLVQTLSSSCVLALMQRQKVSLERRDKVAQTRP